MRTERDADGTGQLTKDGRARPTPSLTRRITELGSRLAQRRQSHHDVPATLRPTSPDQAQAETAALAAKSAQPVPVVAAGAALAALAWWRARRRRRAAGHGN